MCSGMRLMLPASSDPHGEQSMAAYSTVKVHCVLGSAHLPIFQCCSHLGSVMPAVCLTRPQYVLWSYWESGSSRLPGKEADMVSLLVRWLLERRRGIVEDGISLQLQTINDDMSPGPRHWAHNNHVEDVLVKEELQLLRQCPAVSSTMRYVTVKRSRLDSLCFTLGEISAGVGDNIQPTVAMSSHQAAAPNCKCQACL